jgi:hypothetical protein
VLLIHPLNTEKQHITVVAAYFCIPFVSLCAHRTHESKPPKPRPATTPARVDGRSSFGGAQLCATAHLYERLLPGGASFRSTTFWWCALLYHYFQKDVRGTVLLPFLLHQIRSTTSNCSTCRLLGTPPPEPPALVLPLGITCALSFIYHVLSVLIQIKREHKQSLCCHNVAYFYS